MKRWGKVRKGEMEREVSFGLKRKEGSGVELER